eukprot:s3627_g4.t1
MKKAELPPDEGQWLAIEQETVDALMKRRRIREKSTIGKLQKDEEDLEEEQWRRHREVDRLVAEEMPLMVEDHPDLVVQEMAIIQQLKKMVEIKEDEEEVLRTKVVSAREVSQEWDNWLPASCFGS